MAANVNPAGGINKSQCTIENLVKQIPNQIKTPKAANQVRIEFEASYKLSIRQMFMID